MSRAPTDGWACRPHGRLRHYAGLLGPSGTTAAGFMSKNMPARRVAAVRGRIAARRGPRQRGLVVSPGGRFAFKGVPAAPAPGPRGATVHPVAMATCDMDRPI